MGKGGRFGKYGEHKRFQRLRQSKDYGIKFTKKRIKEKTPPGLPYHRMEQEPEENKKE